MEFNAADIFEGVVDRVPDREAIVYGSTRLTYKDCLLYTSPSPRDIR